MATIKAIGYIDEAGRTIEMPVRDKGIVWAGALVLAVRVGMY